MEKAVGFPDRLPRMISPKKHLRQPNVGGVSYMDRDDQMRFQKPSRVAK